MRIQEMIRHDCLDEETLGFLRAISVDQIQMDLRFGSVTPGGPLLEDELRQGRDFTDYFGQLRDRVEAHGLSLEAAVMRCWPEICLAAEDRDAKIEAWSQMIRSLGQVGVHYLGWAFKPMGNFRTTAAVGRGGARYSTFDYEELMASGDRSMHQPEVAEETMWQSLEHFLAAVVPVAEAAGVRLALHPDDPPIPEPLAGVAQITSTLEQFRRILFEIAPSDYNRMLFCQGCMTELLGADGVYAAIEEMAASGKIGFVHFRNVAGAVPRFREVFIDEGEVDMPRAMQLYRDNGYEGSFMMDHTPHFAGSHDELRGKAFAVGYIRALIQQVYG